jgi:hypothetical protein
MGAIVGGRAAGILAAVVGGLIAWFLWMPPRGSFTLEWPIGHLTVGLYITTTTILLLVRGLNETLKALESERDLSAELFRELQHRTANSLQAFPRCCGRTEAQSNAIPSVTLGVIDTARRPFEIMSRVNRRLYNPDRRLTRRWHSVARCPPHPIKTAAAPV